MNILIIGGNRFVGKLIAQKLILTHNVTVINRKGIGPQGCTILKGDRNNSLEFTNTLYGLQFDVIIDMCLYNLKQCFLIEKLFLGKISKYIFMSSIASKIKSFGEYGIGKKMCEEFLKHSSIPHIILQPTYIIGEGDHSKRMDYYINRIINNDNIHVEGNGDKLINFIDAEDLCNIVCRLVEPTYHQKIKNITYELSCNEYSSLNDLIWRLSQFLEKDNLLKRVYVKYNSSHKGSYEDKKCFANNFKLKSQINPQLNSFNTTLKKIIDEYKN